MDRGALLMTFSLHTDAFVAGGVIPKKYTCEGVNVSPAFAWIGAPLGTQSFLLICDDPDAPNGVFRHWAIYDIPAERTSLEEGFKAKMPIKLGFNDFGNVGYGGPMPPRGHGPHRYYFQLYALSSAALPVKASAACLEIAKAAEPFILASAEVMGTYER